jgi:hypothetical protein
MYNAEIDGRQVKVTPRDGIFEIDYDGNLILELGPARALAETLARATAWTAEEISDEDPE